MKKIPEPKKPRGILPPDEMSTVSSTECTGLMPTPATDETERNSYRDIYNMETIQKEKNKNA